MVFELDIPKIEKMLFKFEQLDLLNLFENSQPDYLLLLLDKLSLLI